MGLLDKIKDKVSGLSGGLLSQGLEQNNDVAALLDQQSKSYANVSTLNPLLNKHFRRLKILEPELGKQNLDKWTNFVSMVESDNNLKASNKERVGDDGSSAEGMYQFLTDNTNGQSSLQSAVNRTKKYVNEPWLDEVYKTGNIKDLTKDQQTLLFHGDIFQKTAQVNGKKVPGLGDNLMRGVLTGDKNSMLEGYKILHHTNPDEATLKRMAKYEYLLD